MQFSDNVYTKKAVLPVGNQVSVQLSQSALEYLHFAGALEGLGGGTGTEGVQYYHFAAGGVSLGV